MDGPGLADEEPEVHDDQTPLPPVRGGEREPPPDESRSPMPPFTPPEDAGRDADDPEGHAAFAWGWDDEAEDPTVAVELVGRDAFPMDAFIIPDEVERLPAPSQLRASRSVTDDLARRLGEFADALRADGAEALTRAMDADRDSFEANLAAFLVGFINTQGG